ncbi:Uncharacterized protein Adt_43844 [Abeliophyllum distichum]|uniref:C2H2-type domain-containing protein n=1 Tax=Abeliophyllum distichum TaxID=126358 RepID=A0ABD1P9V3_9LAMI
MGSAAVTTTNTPPLPPPCGSGGAKTESLTYIDITQLSQSDLQALSLCSESAFDLHRTDDLVTPDIDRTLFNESAGSRRQAYSGLRHPHHRSHSRLPGLHPALKTHHHSHPSDDPVNHSIIHFLKHFLNGNHDPPPPPPPPPLPAQAELLPPPANGPGLGLIRLQEKFKIKLHGGENKRKKVRRNRNSNKKRLLENGVGMELQKVNVKGEVVDFENLEKNGDELYSEELRRRTMGMDTEEGVLGFLSGLEGQWCSRRKKRKYVDAGAFGDALPIGWKLLLGLRRRDFRVSVYCRRCISPTGQQFISCKEATSFLRSYFEGNDADRPRDQKTCSIQQAYGVATENPRPTDKIDELKPDMLALSTLVSPTPSDAHENDGCLVGIENLPEVQVQDIFECVKCNLTFDEKKAYLEHLFSFHQKTTKRYRFGTPIGEGVIIRDGKYECQFCHKVFDERRSYNGHVGVHVRNSGKGSDELVTTVTVQENSQSPVKETLPSRTSKMDALIEIAQNSIFENSKGRGTSEQATGDKNPSMMNLEEAQAPSTDYEMNLGSDPIEIQTKDFEPDKAPNEGLNADDGQAKMVDENLVRNDNTRNINVIVGSNCTNDLEHVELNDIENYENSELETGFEDRGSKPSQNHLEDTPGLVEEISFHNVPSASSVPLAPSFQYFPPFDSMSSKVEHGFSVIDQKLENDTGFEELRFDDIEPFRYGFVNGQESPSLPGGSIGLRNNAGIEDGFNSTIRFGSEEVALNTADISQLTTVCVWCRTEFKLDGVESESPSDSIGYMCPTCKDNISGHLNGGLSMDPGGF